MFNNDDKNAFEGAVARDEFAGAATIAADARAREEIELHGMPSSATTQVYATLAVEKKLQYLIDALYDTRRS